MSAVAGLVFVTAKGAVPRVAARLATEEGLVLQGGDGDAQIAAVWEGESAEGLEALAARLMAADADLLGVFPTYFGEDEER